MTSVVESHLDSIRHLCVKHGVVRFDLFGSALRDDFDPRTSDLDFLVEFAPDMVRLGFKDPFFLLLKDLEELFNRKVDLIEPDTIRNETFRREVNKTRVPVYVA